MKYPMINRQPRREVNIPELSGGLNLRDSLTGIRDNQMTDCINMWYKDGALRTRPPFVTSLARLNMVKSSDTGQVINTRLHNEIKISYQGFNCVLATSTLITVGENGMKGFDIRFELQAVDKIFALPKISGITADDITYFCAEMNGVLYCYVSDFSIWKLEYNKEVQLGEDAPVWVKVGEDEMYVPRVCVHCQRSNEHSFEGTMLEGYNIFSDKYKMIYSAYNENDSDNTHPMRYAMAVELSDSFVGDITAEITIYDSKNDKMTTVPHTVHIDGKSKSYDYYEVKGDKKTEDGLLFYAKKDYVGFLEWDKFDSVTAQTAFCIDTDEKRKLYGGTEDNIVLILPYESDLKQKKKVFNMTQSIWFGGAANGINGGSRLFLCGNTKNDDKSLVVWSGLNNPLYFSENCYAYVGSNSRAVTAFARQGENLVIFKENKIYATYYQQNANIDADSLINQSVVDYEANSVYFPIIQINGYIGCDCPHTIQMCRNRLVWATSEGRVYTLCTMSQYNEHTVYELSDMIAPRLKDNKEKLKSATSADFDGHYILFLGNCALVMDYCSYGYQYVYSYSKSDDANALIPWYYWEFAFLQGDNTSDEYKNACICTLDDNVVLRAYFDASSEDKSAFVGFAMDEKEYSGADRVFRNDFNCGLLQIEDSVIKSRVATKLFELGGGIYNVNVEAVSVKLGSNDAQNVTARLITEQGEEIVIIKDRREHTGITAVNFIRGKVLYPTVRNVTKFGLDFECDGRLCIDGLSLKYRLLGGVK